MKGIKKILYIISACSVCLSIALVYHVLLPSVQASEDINGENDKDEVLKSSFVPLPTYPPIWERSPEGFSEESLKTFREENPPVPYSILRDMIDENTTVDFKGFIGQFYLSKVTSNEIKVLEQTVNIQNENGMWTARGLIRNETLNSVDVAYVKAILRDDAGNILEEPEAKVLVNSIRPGEPAPFFITSNTDFELVNQIEWYVKEGDTIPSSFSRDFVIYNYYELPYGTTSYNGIERVDDPLSYVLQIGTENLGEDVDKASIIVVWVDDAGKIFWLEESELDSNYHGVKKDSRAHFREIIVKEPEIAQVLDKLNYMIWVMGE